MGRDPAGLLPPTVALARRKMELQKEIFSLRRRLRREADNPVGWIELGDRLAELLAYRPSAFRLKRAREAYERAMLQAPDDPVAFNNLGVLLCDAGDSQQALGLFERALELDPEDATIHENRAIALFRLGRAARIRVPAGLVRKPRTQSAAFDPREYQDSPGEGSHK